MPVAAIAARAIGEGAPTSATPAIAAKSPPITKAPSPPMIIRPTCAGKAVHNPVRISGAARVRVFWTENHEPTEPWTIYPYTASGLTPATATKSPNSKSEATSAPTGTSTASTAPPGTRRCSRRAVLPRRPPIAAAVSSTITDAPATPAPPQAGNAPSTPSTRKFINSSLVSVALNWISSWPAATATLPVLSLSGPLKIT